MRGRPLKSEIREKITALIDRLKFSYGYEIYKYYRQIFDNATSRVIYYHLKKGCETGEFIMVNIKRVPGNFTWGDESERIYYTLGPFASTKQEWWKKTLTAEINPREINYNWNDEIYKRIEDIKSAARSANNKEKLKLINKCNKLIKWVKEKTNSPEQFIKEIESVKLFLK